MLMAYSGLRKSYREKGLNLEIYIADVTGKGAKLIYNEERKPGLVKLIDTLKFIKGGSSGGRNKARD